jgi:hypothetical protein
MLLITSPLAGLSPDMLHVQPPDSPSVLRRERGQILDMKGDVV